MMQDARPDALTLSAFALTVLIGGTNFVAVRFSNLELAPFWGAGLRFLAASAILLALSGARRLPFPSGRALVGALLYGVLSFTLTYALMYWALLTVPAGMASVVMAQVPLFTFLLAWGHGLESFRWRGLVGALLGLVGIAAMMGSEAARGFSPLALLAMVAAAAAAAEAGVLMKHFPRSHPVTTNGLAMGVGALLLLPLSALAGEPWTLPVSPSTWLVLGYLVLVGSCGLFVLFLFVLRRWTASATSYGFVLFPLVATAMGSLLAGEAVSRGLLLGGLLVLSGVYVGAIARPRKPALRPAAVES